MDNHIDPSQPGAGKVAQQARHTAAALNCTAS